MAKIYFREITKPDSTMNLADVPARWREQVRELLINSGYTV